MNAVRMLRGLRFLSERRRLELYPPFWLMGVKVLELTPDWGRVRLRLPLRFASRNAGGGMFGGYQASLADPIPALACVKRFPGYSVWTRRLRLDFRHEGLSDLELRFLFDTDLDREIREQLDRRGRATPTFALSYYRSDGVVCTQVENTVAIRPRRSR